MSDDFESSLPGEEGPEERAFRRCDQHKFRGQPLEPFTFARKTATVALIQAMRDGENLDGAMDIAIVLWLCSQPKQTVKQVRRNPSAFIDAIDDWADEKGIFVGDSFRADPEAVEVFNKIHQDVADSSFEAGVEKSADSESKKN